MEIKKIINFCKKRGALYLFDGDGCQWVSDGVNGPELSRRYGVSSNCVYYHVNEARREKALLAMKEYNLVRPPRPRAERTAYARELRSYKRKLLLEVRDGERGEASQVLRAVEARAGE